MPTYEYKCLKCGHTFEEYREITAPPRARCPQCRGRVQRLVSGGAGIVFRGSGWYSTDSRKPRAGTAPPSGGGEDTKAAETAAVDAAKSAAADATKPTKAKGKRGKP